MRYYYWITPLEDKLTLIDMTYNTLINITIGLIASIAVSFVSPVLNPTAKTVSLTYNVPADCTIDSMQLFTFSGIGFKPFEKVAKSDNSFQFEVPNAPSTFYFVGPNATTLKSVILGKEKNVAMSSKCDDYKKATIDKSKINKEYAAFLNARSELNTRTSATVQAYRKTTEEDTEKRAELNVELAKIDKARVTETSKYKSEFINKIAALFAYQSFQNNAGDYTVEMDYFADSFFSQVDLSDPIYNQMSVVYEAFSNYTATISRAKTTKVVHESRLLNVLSKLDENGNAYKFALGAVVNTLYSMKHKNMPAFATIYVNKYYETDKAELGQLKVVVDNINANTVGAPAPDIILTNPEGEEVALSDLKGNIVLIDFWASWCGPCRRENPNVVRMYDKYKAQGFEIYGVSLDSKKDRWVKAIEADGLTWPQGSDLRGWQSQPAKVYGVRSIPTTVLVDADGNILARNLRGPSLESKLEEIFN